MKIPVLACAHLGFKPDYSPEFKELHKNWEFIRDSMRIPMEPGLFGAGYSYGKPYLIKEMPNKGNTK